MADVDTGDILRLGAIWTLSGVYEIANVFHVRVASGGGMSFADAADDVAEYMADIYAELLDGYCNQMDTHSLTMQNLTQVTTYGAFSWAAPLVGVVGGDYTAPGVCYLTWARTLKPRVQGRKYWGVFSENGMVNGLWSATYRGYCLAAHQIHLDSFVGTNGLEVVGVAYNRTLETWTAFTTLAYTDEPSYQRRRKRGRGS